MAATFEDGYPRRLAYASGAAGTSALCVARAARVLVLASGTTVSLWRITQRKNSLSEVDDVEVKSRDKQDGWDKLVEMDLNIRTHITAAAISDDAKWLVVSDAYESKLFALESTVSTEPSTHPLTLAQTGMLAIWWHQAKANTQLQYRFPRRA